MVGYLKKMDKTNKELIEEVEKTIVEPIIQDINRIVQQSWDYFQKHDVMSDFNCYVIDKLPDNKWKNKILRFLEDKLKEVRNSSQA